MYKDAVQQNMNTKQRGEQVYVEMKGTATRRAVTYERVERRIRGNPPHFVDGLEGKDVLIIVWASQGAAGAAAGAQVTRREGGWST